MDITAAKIGVIGTIAAALITGAVALYIHYDGGEKKENSEGKIQSDARTELSIVDAHVPPINTKHPSSFYVRVKNGSRNAADNVVVLVDFGESSIESCETAPLESPNIDDQESSLAKFTFPRLEKEDEVFIYCLISHPSFRYIKVTADNTIGTKELNFAEMNNGYSSRIDGILNFLEIIGAMMGIVFAIFVCFWFVYIVGGYLNRKFSGE